VTGGAARAGAVFASALFIGCAPLPASRSARADATMVRLDIVERGLLIAAADLDSVATGEKAKTASWTTARDAVDSASRALECTRKAVATWDKGDARNVEPRMNALALRLSAVREALGPAGARPAPGLFDVLPAPANDPTPENTGAGECAQGCR
jgi:hypothetical protein